MKDTNIWLCEKFRYDAELDGLKEMKHGFILEVSKRK